MYATLAMPGDEQEREANARFYAFKRGRLRYLTALVLGAIVWLATPYASRDNKSSLLTLAAIGVYAIPFVVDLVHSLREAKQLFPSTGAR